MNFWLNSYMNEENTRLLYQMTKWFAMYDYVLYSASYEHSRHKTYIVTLLFNGCKSDEIQTHKKVSDNIWQHWTAFRALLDCIDLKMTHVLHQCNDNGRGDSEIPENSTPIGSDPLQNRSLGSTLIFVWHLSNITLKIASHISWF